jgi:hypothetical protein
MRLLELLKLLEDSKRMSLESADYIQYMAMTGRLLLKVRHKYIIHYVNHYGSRILN